MEPKAAKNTIFLASSSPRRMALLEQMGLPYLSRPQNIDERFSGRSPEKEACRLAENKLKAFLYTRENDLELWALAADTFIISPGGRKAKSAKLGRFLGKPSNRDEARRMLEVLSGKTHRVITGLAVLTPAGIIKKSSVKSWVKFSRLSEKDILWYLDSGEWQDAAGAYRIQGKGAGLVRSLKGSYSNIMGLPLEALYGILVDSNYPF